MSKRKKEHVFIRNENGGYVLWCEYCQQEYSPAIPCPMEVFLGILEGFQKSHKRCVPKSEHKDHRPKRK